MRPALMVLFVKIEPRLHSLLQILASRVVVVMWIVNWVSNHFTSCGAKPYSQEQEAYLLSYLSRHASVKKVNRCYHHLEGL
jgi:hypothetical protein